MMHHGSTTNPIRVRGLVAGVCAGVAAYVLVGFLDSLHHGDPNTGFFLFIAPAVVPIASLLYALLGSPMFLMARRKSPSRGALRLAFVMIVITPLTLAWCVFVTLLIDGLIGFGGHAAPDNAHLTTRINTTLVNYWRGTLFVGSCGGLACWCADQAPLLWSNDRIRRQKARIIAYAMATSIMIVPIIFVLFNQDLVVVRAQKIAGSRPYCLLVPSYDEHLYRTVTKRSQLSAWELRASYELVSGTRGGFYNTNHAVLVLEGPRDYMNWSYVAEDFVNDPLINSIADYREPKILGMCQPIRDFAAELK